MGARQHAKAESGEPWARAERLRYAAYELESRLLARLAAAAPRQWSLCLILTRAPCARPWQEVLDAALEAGADCVQVREKGCADADLLSHSRSVVRVAHAHGASVIVNDRPDIARLSGADGVHVGQGDLAIREARRALGEGLVGASTHSMAEVRAAVEAGADYCGIGAMFATATKPVAVSGPAYARAFLEAWPAMPHLAIGGITAENAGALAEAGVRGVAVSGAICGAADPGAATDAILRALAQPLQRVRA